MVLRCPTCDNNGKSKYKENLFLLWGGFMTGTGIYLINSQTLGRNFLSITLALVITFSGIYYLLSYFYGRKNCPLCSKKIAREKDKSICTSCNEINNYLSKRRQNIYGSVILIIFGLIGILSLFVNALSKSSQYFEWAGSSIMLVIGLYGISTNISSTQYCTKCGGKNTVIPLDSPKAQLIVKENNLSVPES